jgi:hypothetical protein
MGIFLRWGIFGILAVAGLLYAYNASKKLTENRRASAPAAQTQDSAGAPPIFVPPECAAELAVAELALEARRDGETFDRLLRNQQIAFVNDDKQRARLANVARRWYDLEGAEPPPATLGATVVDECRKFKPAP